MRRIAHGKSVEFNPQEFAYLVSPIAQQFVPSVIVQQKDGITGKKRREGTRFRKCNFLFYVA
jgi:hypothetical protein